MRILGAELDRLVEVAVALRHDAHRLDVVRALLAGRLADVETEVGEDLGALRMRRRGLLEQRDRLGEFPAVGEGLSLGDVGRGGLRGLRLAPSAATPSIGAAATRIMIMRASVRDFIWGLLPEWVIPDYGGS